MWLSSFHNANLGGAAIVVDECLLTSTIDIPLCCEFMTASLLLHQALNFSFSLMGKRDHLTAGCW
jgi:hypothetical protein